MNTLNTLLEISIYSVVLFLAILAVKKVFANSMSPVLHFAVWFLLIARLCIPVTIDSGFKLFTVPAQAAQASPQASGQADPDSSAIQDSTDMSVSQAETYNAPVVTVKSNDTAQNSTPFNWTLFIIAVWFFGISLYSVRMIMSAVKMNRIINNRGIIPNTRINRIFTECKTEMNIKRNIPVYILADVTTPALTIGFRPKMIIPAAMAEALGDEQIGYAIRHELMHYKRKDNVLSLLLRILEALYWFNPVVWIMNRLIVGDMETACDSMVVRALDKRERRQYVLTLLDMLSQKRTPQFLLGMALYNSEKIAEKRIRGVYMKNKSKPGIKITAVVLAAVMFVCCFTTACQPAAAEVKKDAIVVAGMIDAPNKSATTVPSQADKYTAPQTWKDEYTSGSNTVNVDASVVCPEFDSIDIVSMKWKNFTQEQADSFIKYFAGDATLYEGDELDTKKDLENRIAEVKKEIGMTQQERDDTLGGMTVDDLQKSLDDLNSRYDAVLKGVKPKETTSEFTPSKDGPVVEVHTDNGGNNDLLFNVYDFADSGAFFQVRLRDQSKGGKILSYSGEPEEIAQKILNDLGIKDMQLVRTSQAAASNEVGNTKTVTRLFYEPAINGIPVQTTCGLISENRLNNATADIRPNNIAIDISENGLTCLSWFDYAEVTGKVQENVSPLPFEDIMQNFKSNIFQQPIFQNSGDKNSDAAKYNVTKIEFCMVAILKDGSSGEYLLVPAWNFYAKQDISLPDPRMKTGAADSDMCIMTLSAVDGSLIHR